MHVARTLILCSLLLSTAAQAAPGKRPAPVHDQKQEKLARAHFDRAEKAFNLGRFDEALNAYQAAYEALPLPAFLFNIAQCHRNLRNREQAVFFYQRYLSLAPEAPNRPVVEELIAEQQRLLAAQSEQAEESKPAKPEGPLKLDAPPEEDKKPVGGLDAQPAEKPTRWQRTRWWILGAAGVALVGGAILLAGRGGGSLPQGSLGSIDTR